VDAKVHDRELDLLEVLWERGSATVAEVRDALTDDLAYNTVLTILRRMEDKGYVRHEGEGRAHRYFPILERENVRRSALQRLLDGVFGGSPELLLTQIVSDRRLSEAQIRRLQRLLEERLPEEER
jgi:BlaI family transcriptional regulator, penicillinase repressor